MDVMITTSNGRMRGPSTRAGSRIGRELTTHVEEKQSSGVRFVGAPDWTRLIWLDGSAHPDAERLNRAVAFVTSCYANSVITYRMDRVAEPPLRVMRSTDSGDEKVDHDLDVVLDQPSPDFDMGELQQLTEAYRCSTGSALWVVTSDSVGRPVRFTPFSGDEFEIEQVGDRIIGRFWVRTKRGRVPYDPEEVVYFRDVHPGTWKRGLSKLDVALSTLDLGHQIDRTIRNFVKRAMFPGGIVSPHQDWNPDDDEWEKYKEDIESWHSGPLNAGAPLVALGGTTFSRASAPMKELLPEELLDRIETNVSSVFGIPPVVLGWKIGLENSPWSQMGEARRMTTEDTIVPRWRDVEKRMTKALLSDDERMSGLTVRFDTSDVMALQDDDEQRARVAVMMRREWTLDERRQYTGVERIGGDEGDSRESTSTSPMADAAAEDGEDEDTQRILRVIDRYHGKSSDTAVLDWTIFDVSCKAAERTWERRVSGTLETWKRQALRMARDILVEKQVGPGSSSDFTSGFWAWMKDVGESLMAVTLTPLFVSTGETGVRHASSVTGISFSVLQPHIEDYALEEAARVADFMGESTGRAVVDAVQESLDVGETLGGMIRRLEEIPAFGRNRAKLVARTETTRAWNGAQFRSLKEFQANSRDVVYKTWLSAQDRRVRPEHQTLHGERQLIDVAFTNGLMYPGEPNCRCTTTYDTEPHVNE